MYFYFSNHNSLHKQHAYIAGQAIPSSRVIPASRLSLSDFCGIQHLFQARTARKLCQKPFLVGVLLIPS